jgi:predicted transcriptional regulator
MTMSDIESKLSDLQLKVYDLVKLAGWDGKTCDEVEVALGLTHQSASARVHELEKMKLIEQRGTKRKTRAGRTAYVFVLAGSRAAAERTK